tara:strand:- start:668 stop:1099 length:432 start_codon:yes stop_codon:yes gene_type:complete
MAIINYTAEQLYGAGIEVPGWKDGVKIFNLVNPTTNGYFVIESKQKDNSYLKINILGVLSGLSNLILDNFVISRYKIGIFVPPGQSSFTFDVGGVVGEGEVFFRSTGGVYLGYDNGGTPATNHILTEDNNSIITQDGDHLITN